MSTKVMTAIPTSESRPLNLGTELEGLLIETIAGEAREIVPVIEYWRLARGFVEQRPDQLPLRRAEFLDLLGVLATAGLVELRRDSDYMRPKQEAASALLTPRDSTL